MENNIPGQQKTDCCEKYKPEKTLTHGSGRKSGSSSEALWTNFPEKQQT